MFGRIAEAIGVGAARTQLTGTRRAALRWLLGSGFASIAAARAAADVDAGSRLGDDGWRRCRKCRGVFWAAAGAGKCPKGGGHAAGASKNYEIEYGGDVQPGEEDGWRACAKCRGLFWSGSGSGVCPQKGGHDATASHPYILEVNQSPELHEEGGWRYCAKCHGLFLPTGKKRGTCPAGGAHKIYPNFDYNLTFIP
jgi:hypothetical protein